jgi:hypothetical protein
MILSKWKTDAPKLGAIGVGRLLVLAGKRQKDFEAHQLPFGRDQRQGQ